MQTKILLYDIETSPLLAYTWTRWQEGVIDIADEWYMMSYAYRWLGDSKVKAVGLPDTKEYKKDPTNDYGLAKGLWSLLNEADIVVGHNCVEENTLVLKQDLTWVKAGSLKKGDKIVGFEEATKPNETLRDKAGKWRGTQDSVRRIKPTTVTGNKIEKQECCEVELSNGEKVVTTPDHYWLGRTKKDNFYKWLKTEDLKPGYRFTKFWNTWEPDTSYEAGWLCGFIAGEGCLKQSNRAFGVDFYQRPGSTWGQALDCCSKLNIILSEERTQRANGIGRQDTLCTGLLGGKFKIAEDIGRLQIKRFIEKIKWETFGGLKGQNLETVEVVSVKPVGKRNVAVLSTDEKTFFANGYAMHNCNRFDNRKVNARLIKHGFTPPSPYQTIDTKNVAKKYFAFDSNKLTHLGQYLNLGQKVETGGFQLWIDCMAGKEDAWKRMIKYNKQDVELLTQIYLKLRPWIDTHHNINVLDERMGSCPKCGSEKIQKRGFSITRTRKRQRYHCQDCGAWSVGALDGEPILVR